MGALLFSVLAVATSQRTDTPPIGHLGSEIVDLVSFGARGDGLVDDTAAFQAALTAGIGKELRIPKPPLKYRVGPLSIPSNSRILIDEGTIIEARPGFTAEQNLISLADASNVTIVGHDVVFQMPGSEYTTGEHRHCLSVRGGNDVYIEGIACNGSGGDGFYIGTGASFPSRVTLERVSASHNRRQGLSIISGTDIVVRDSSFTDTAGADPECGVDIEPNSPWERLNGITLSNIRTANNAGCGISFSLSNLDRTSQPVDVTVTNYRDDMSPRMGIQAQCNWTTGGGGARGYILVDGTTVENAGLFGVYLKSWQQSCPSLTFRDLAIHNCNRLAEKNKVAVLLYRDRGGTEQLGNIHFVRPVIADTNAETRLDDYFWFLDASGRGFTNVTIENPTLSGARHEYKGIPLLSSHRLRRCLMPPWAAASI
jgi:hypothetical protein